MNETGYYWAYRKGSPVPEVVYVHDDSVLEIWHADGGLLEFDFEPLSEGKWILGEKIVHEDIDKLP